MIEVNHKNPSAGDGKGREAGGWGRLMGHLDPRRAVSRLRQIRDTPHAIAGGIAIGMFYGFMPLWGVKTLASILTAWLCRCSKLAAAITVSLHDVLLPVMPVVMRWEYELGYWMMHGSWPEAMHVHLGRLRVHDLFSWTTFLDVGRPLLYGSMVVGLGAAVVAYALALPGVRAWKKTRGE